MACFQLLQTSHEIANVVISVWLPPRLACPVCQAALLAAKAVREQLADALLGIETAREAAGDAEDGGGDSALVIDGKALAHALGPDMRQTVLAVRAA